MSAINTVQQGLLSQLNQLSQIAGGEAIKPAMQLPGTLQQPAIGASFEQALRAVDADQVKASESMAAVDSGESENLVGAMIDSQKASLSFTALLQVRNKLSGAFDDIMRMPL
ncbi:flagellar hook-basal body complex protein FliE [Pseudomonas sp. TE3786]